MMVRVLYFAAWFMLIFGLSACAHNVHTHTKPRKSEPPLPLEKHIQRPTHLPRTNIIAMRGEWDIFIIDDEKYSEPYGTLSASGETLHLKIPNFTKSLLDGTFYGDRKTIWFDGPYMSFIAKRSDRVIPIISWLDKTRALEACLLDHPKIGADKYYQIQSWTPDSNRRPIVTLVGDGIKYWDDCKPDYEVEVKTVKHGLPFLEAKSLEVKADISDYSSEFITGGRVKRRTNSIDVNVNPDWAKENQEIIKRLTNKYPYIVWRKDLIPEEVLASGKY